MNITLGTSNSFKAEVLKNPVLRSHISEAIVKKSLPMFFWRLKGLNDGVQFEILLDAIDIAKGSLYLDTIVYDQTYAAWLDELFQP